MDLGNEGKGPERRYGMTIPLDGIPLVDQREWIAELADIGYTDVWSAEADGADAFTPLHTRWSTTCASNTPAR